MDLWRGRYVSDLAFPSAPEIAAELRSLDPAYAQTALIDLPRLAEHLGVAQVLPKDESRRMLGA